MTVEDPRRMTVACQLPAQATRARWHAAPYRCPCGFADDDASEFDRHLDALEGIEPEHFEVLDGWTFQQVQQWQASAATPDGGRRARPRRRGPVEEAPVATAQEERPALAGAAGPGWPAATLAGPVFTVRSGWLDGESKSHVVLLELPLSASEMVAALYGESDRLTSADLGTEEEVWGHIAVVVVQEGLVAIGRIAELIDAQERCRTLAVPRWLALCRRRVAEVRPACWSPLANGPDGI